MVFEELLDNGVLVFNLILQSADCLLHFLAVFVEEGQLVVMSFFLSANVAVEELSYVECLVETRRIFGADVDSEI